MAKGLRSSAKKSNRAKLRSRVFSPVETARTERLSRKLLELAGRTAPKATEDAEMEIGEGRSIDSVTLSAINADGQDIIQPKAKDKDKEAVEAAPEAMELDSKPHAAGIKSNNPNRVHKKRRSKSKASIVFSSYNKRKASGSAGKQKG